MAVAGAEVHALLHHLHPDAAAEIGQAIRRDNEDQAHEDRQYLG